MLNLAVGTEWRNEHFTIGLGQRKSWDFGPFSPAPLNTTRSSPDRNAMPAERSPRRRKRSK